MRLSDGWYWICVNIAMEPTVFTIDEMKDSMRELRSEVNEAEWKKIRSDIRTNGCYYCIGERPGCGLYRVVSG